MSSTTNNLPTIAVFGATGGVANSTLVYALRNARNCIALARTPSRLRDQLLAQKLDEETLDAHLTIVQGDALDKSAVKQTLTANGTPNHLVSSIVCGLGATPHLRWNWNNPFNCVGLDNPNLCGTAAVVLTDALQEIFTTNPSLKQSSKPDLTFVSTTGISQPRGPEDVPFLLRWLYHQILAVPHLDKRDMEAVFRGNIDGKDAVRGVLFTSVIGVRPTLLTGEVNADSGIGLDKLRAGREATPETGYTVQRADVGHWIWQELVQGKDKRQEWGNEMISLTS